VPVPDGEPGAEHEETAEKEKCHFRHERVEKRTGEREKRKGAHAAGRLQAPVAEIFLEGETEKEAETQQDEKPLRLEQRVGQAGEKGDGALFFHRGAHLARMPASRSAGSKGMTMRGSGWMPSDGLPR